MAEQQKAYRVDAGDDEGHGVIVFATSNVAARRMGVSELDTDFECIESCRRAPEFDSFAHLGYVPDVELINRGWWVECHGCNVPIPGYDDDGDELEPVFDGRSTYCSVSCRDSEQRAARLRKRGSQLGGRVLRNSILKRWPDAEVTGTHVYVLQGRIQQAIAYFKFPGCHHGHASFTLRDRTRPDRQVPELCVPRGDIPTWEQYDNRSKSDG